MPRILFIGDIVGSPARLFIRDHLPGIRRERGIDCVVANAENAAGGAGLTTEIAHDLLQWGVDAITLGDHVWDQRRFDREIDQLAAVCRPANLPPGVPGKPWLIVEVAGMKIAVVTVLGRTLMKLMADCPFRGIDAALGQLSPLCDAVLVEFHAETTAEKIAMGWYLDGRALAVLGTHTHVVTADECILPAGTAYITDVGMTGPHASVLGREIAPVIARFLDGLPRRFHVAESDVRLNAVVLDIDAGSKQVVRIERLAVTGAPAL